MGNNFCQSFNIQSQSLQDILSKGANYQLDTALLKTIQKTLPTTKDITEEYVKDLIIFLKNDKNFTPVAVIQYMMSLFNLRLSDASLLYQDYTPTKESTQNRFQQSVSKKTRNRFKQTSSKRIIGQSVTKKTEYIYKAAKILNNPSSFKILQLVHENPFISISNLHQKSHIDKRSIYRYLNQLEEINIVVAKQTTDKKTYSVQESIYNSLMDIIENFSALVEKK